MNWYKQIKFANKMIPVGDMCGHIYQSIQLQNNGKWTIETEKLAPGYRDQKRFRCKLTGTDVVLPGDWFHIKTYVYIRKAPHVVHPYEGDYGIVGDWREPNMIPSELKETIETRWENFNAMKPMEIKEYNSETGSELIDFTTVIWGAKAEPKDKGYFNIEEIGESQIAQLKTPYEIGQFVKTAINDFYFRGNDGDNDEPEDNPVPSTPGVKDREYSYV